MGVNNPVAGNPWTITERTVFGGTRDFRWEPANIARGPELRMATTGRSGIEGSYMAGFDGTSAASTRAEQALERHVAAGLVTAHNGPVPGPGRLLIRTAADRGTGFIDRTPELNASIRGLRRQTSGLLSVGGIRPGITTALVGAALVGGIGYGFKRLVLDD